ncbi:MAG: hypothetical protein RLZZ343_738 [Actinomycetota bacterium]|jgi:hypothetical protein
MTEPVKQSVSRAQSLSFGPLFADASRQDEIGVLISVNSTDDHGDRPCGH